MVRKLRPRPWRAGRRIPLLLPAFFIALALTACLGWSFSSELLGLPGAKFFWLPAWCPLEIHQPKSASKEFAAKCQLLGKCHQQNTAEANRRESILSLPNKLIQTLTGFDLVMVLKKNHKATFQRKNNITLLKHWSCLPKCFVNFISTPDRT